MTNRKESWLRDCVSPAPAVRLGRLDGSLGYTIRLAQLRIFAAFSDAASRYALTPSQFAVLLLIEANPGIKQIELASVLDVDRSTMVRLVDRCEAAKLVRRGSSKADRRIAPPLLTARGRALVERLAPLVSTAEDAATGLSPAERAVFFALLKRVAAQPQGVPS